MELSSGKCGKCQQVNSYSSLVCDACGARLPWADALQNRKPAPAPSIPPPHALPGVAHRTNYQSSSCTARFLMITGRIFFYFGLILFLVNLFVYMVSSMSSTLMFGVHPMILGLVLWKVGDWLPKENPK